MLHYSLFVIPFVRASTRPSFHEAMLTEDSSCRCNCVVQLFWRLTLNKHSRVEQCTVCIEPCLVDDGILHITNRQDTSSIQNFIFSRNSTCVYKRMPRWFPSFQVATACLSCSPPDLNFLVTLFFHICVHVK